MEHPHIDDAHVVDRYLAGELPENDVVRFEEHLFECEACLEAAEWGNELRRGVQAVAASVDSAETPAEVPAVENVETVPTSPPGFSAWLASAAGRSVFAAMALGVLALGSAVLWQQTELNRLRDAPAGVAPSTAKLSEPTADLQVASVGVVRDGNATVIRLDPARSVLLLSLELPEVTATRYRVTLYNDAGEVVWQGEDVEPNLYDTLVLALPSSFLARGEYRIALAGLPEGERIGEMTLRLSE